MKKIVRLTESELIRIIERVINEQTIDGPPTENASMFDSFVNDLKSVESEMDGLLNDLKSSNEPIDKKRFLSSLRNKTTQVFFDYFENAGMSRQDSNKLNNLFMTKQSEMMDSFRQKLS